MQEKKREGPSFKALFKTNFWHMIGCEDRQISKDHHFPWVDHRSCRELTEFGLCGMLGTWFRGKGLDRIPLSSKSGLSSCGRDSISGVFDFPSWVVSPCASFFPRWGSGRAWEAAEEPLPIPWNAG